MIPDKRITGLRAEPLTMVLVVLLVLVTLLFVAQATRHAVDHTVSELEAAAPGLQ